MRASSDAVAYSTDAVTYWDEEMDEAPKEMQKSMKLCWFSSYLMLNGSEVYYLTGDVTRC